MKIKIRASGDGLSSVPSTPLTETPTPATAQTPGTTGKPRIKLKSSQPATPVGEVAPSAFPASASASASASSSSPSQQPPPLAEPLGPPPTKPKRPYNRKPKPQAEDGSSQKKRTASDDIAPANTKRPTLSLHPSRRSSTTKAEQDDDDLAAPTPVSAGPRISLKARKAQPDGAASAARRDSKRGGFRLKPSLKAPPPKRPVGVGYDSEDSDAEVDPLIESQFILRMQPGPDCDYLRDAIANKMVGLPRNEGGADVSLKFLDKDHRRVSLIVRGTLYAAAMLDLPCIIEGMKSWDKRGWWKVADICQMLLVLGPTESDATAKTYPLPKEVDKNTWAYPHGLTPPMHYVRKRRFRKRASYRTVEHIDEEVERLIQADKDAESATFKVVDDSIDDTMQGPDDGDYDDDDDDDDDDEDADGEDPDNYLNTTENGYGGAYTEEPDAEGDDDEGFDVDLEAELRAGLETGHALPSAVIAAAAAAAAAGTAPSATTTTTSVQPPLPVADAAANLGAVESAIAEAMAAPSPSAATAAPTPSIIAPSSEDAGGAPGESSEDDDDDDDDDESSSDEDAIDEDLVERERELEGQRQDVEELERRISQAKVDIAGQKNALLRQRKVKLLEQLEEELGVKRRALGLGEDD
ncbi:hypothetical protein AAFC00_002839 [Neodothiora populina]|uniref:TAFII55 protein conserved region domain-containing protein n=1 Tax=Neodothiora populina TaxID=2781224 RepID=A0ABR3P8E4_9PEZI